MATPSPSQQGKDVYPYKRLSAWTVVGRYPVVSYMHKALTEMGRRRLISAFLPWVAWKWFSHYIRSRLGCRHLFLSYDDPKAGTGVYALGDDNVIGGEPDPKGEVRVGLVGDWGTGTDEANAVTSRMMGQFDPHYTIHLGDVYYVGDLKEMEENCLGKTTGKFAPCLWPTGRVGTFSMNGNHEMYALGKAYFNTFLPRLGIRSGPGTDPSGQKASFFCLQNDHWQIIALDTGYNSISIPFFEYFFTPDSHLEPALLQWLKNGVNPNGNRRGIILLSHHQYFSAFEAQYPKPAEQLRGLIDRPVLWFWGHEHRMAVYGQGGIPKGIQAFGRCIGHGGMPVDITKRVRGRTDFPPVVYDHRRYQPPGEDIVVGLNGFAVLIFRGCQLEVNYCDFQGENNVLLREFWETRDGELIGKDIQLLDSRLTVVGDLNRAIGK